MAIVAVYGQEYLSFRYKGHMQVSKEKPTPIEGPIFLEFLKTMNLTVITGMHMVDHKQHTAFAFVSKIVKYSKDGDSISIEADCWEGAWGLKKFNDLVGKVIINGTVKEIYYLSNCSQPISKTNWTITAKAEAVSCPLYLPPEAARRAQMLLGEKADAYKPVHVINYAVMGYPYIERISNCTWWLKNFPNVTQHKPGFVVVGLDGNHCGIIDKEGDKFIHSNPVKREVTENPIIMLRNFFPKGYIFKEYKC